MADKWKSLEEYYKSPEWAAKRNERLKIDSYRCARCGFTRALEVHHITYTRFGHEDVYRDLVTLCKKCHGEIEKQKKEVNPIDAPPECHSVYLAGKISRNGWRESIGGCRTNSVVNGDDYIDYLVNFTQEVNDSLVIVGPTFVACDHGCYHGPESHGAGLSHYGCANGNANLTREDVLCICKAQIDRADIVFAYIDCEDCFGTIAEIGYAHAQGKDLVIKFANENLRKEMWFADKMQQRTGSVSDRWIKEQLLSRIQEV